MEAGSLTVESGLTLDARALDRAAGVLLGQAVGDALGVPYEFAPPLADHEYPQMIGGGLGPFAPGEYSDDTQMAACIAEVSATGADLRTTEALDAIAANFLRWYASDPADIGMQTSAILGSATRTVGPAGAIMRALSQRRAATHPMSAGNGSLMRTAIVALAHLDDASAMAEAAAAVSTLTHADPDCADACILWCSGIRTAVLDGTFGGVRAGIALLHADRRDLWSQRLDEAEAHPPRHFGAKNGWVVAALQAAWSAVIRTPVPDDRPADGSFPADHFRLALEAAVRSGNDTDTVAAIAGGLLGARWGSSGIPTDWQRRVHGWPGLTGADLVRLAVLTARGGRDDAQGWPSAPQTRESKTESPAFAVPHPFDPGVWLGNLATAQRTGPAPVDAVVSLCRVGTAPILPGNDVEHIRIWLVDRPGANANLPFALDQAAREVLRLRREGKRVLLHCVAGRSRTPAVAARYACLAYGVKPQKALQHVRRSLGRWTLPLNWELLEAVFTLAGAIPPKRRTKRQVGARSFWRAF
ncbi:MAG: hydrolase [Streptomycetaceae bacterium]|nr:hydrolase [Streptomycetaceae bacterium]